MPGNLLPPLTEARDDVPAIYENGCHLTQPETEPRECVFGVPDAAATVVLIGDSHAAQWFPALERLATERGWRLVALTKSACTPAALTVWNTTFKRAYTECDTWREAVRNRVMEEAPELAIVVSSHPYPSVANGQRASADDGTALADGLAATLRSLVALADHVLLLADTPKFAVDPPECLSAHLDDVLACSEPRATMLDPGWTAREAAVAATAGAAFVDPTSWACPTDPCPAVVGRFLVYRDQHHLATPYVLALRHRLAAALPGDLP